MEVEPQKPVPMKGEEASFEENSVNSLKSVNGFSMGSLSEQPTFLPVVCEVKTLLFFNNKVADEMFKRTEIDFGA